MSAEAHSPQSVALNFFYTHDFQILHFWPLTSTADLLESSIRILMGISNIYVQHVLILPALRPVPFSAWKINVTMNVTWTFRPKLLESSLTCSCSFVVVVVVLSCHFWSISKTSQIYPQNKSWINHFSPSLPSLVYPCLHHVVLDDGNWPLTSLLSTWSPTVYVPHSSQTKPLKTKSNHIIPLFGIASQHT